jgi:hypothetical protein
MPAIKHERNYHETIHPLLSAKSNGRQLIVTTHNSFVLNKLGVENVILFNKDKNATLADLPSDIYDYFMKLPGHDTNFSVSQLPPISDLRLLPFFVHQL